MLEIEKFMVCYIYVSDAQATEHCLEGLVMLTTDLPGNWMPDVPMKRIHLHWTGGQYLANSTDRNAYHILIEGDGKVVRGNKSIAANVPGGKNPASHTKNANTGAIGVSMCCMSGARDTPYIPGKYPMTQVQWNKAIEVIATLAKRYGILVTPVTTLTHAEVQPNLGILQNNKWDIICLPFDSSKIVGSRPVGDLMRLNVAKILDKINTSSVSPQLPTEMRLPRFRISGVAPSTLNFRNAPNGEKKGEISEGLLVERLAIDGHWSKIRTPKGFVGWVFSDFLRAT